MIWWVSKEDSDKEIYDEQNSNEEYYDEENNR